MSSKDPTLSQLHSFLESQYGTAQTCFQRADAVRQALTQAFTEEMEAWQGVLGTCLPLLEAKRAEMPPAFASTIDRVEEEERQSLRDEIASLEAQIAEGQAKSDELLAAAQAETAKLRDANPELNTQDEELQALATRYQDEFAHAFEEEESLRASSSLGWLSQFGPIRRLKRQQREAKRRQEKTLAKLHLLRQGWADSVKAAGDKQSELREQWQEVGIRLAENQTRHAHLRDNLEALALQNGLQRVLMELRVPPEVPGEFGAQLADLARRNGVRAAYEESLQVSAEFLGRTKGVGTGLSKFGTSVANVVREQRRYNLKNVRVRVPPLALEVLGTFRDVGERLAEPNSWASQPERVTALLDPYNKTRLSDDSIKALFETMGEELNRATSAWK